MTHINILIDKFIFHIYFKSIQKLIYYQISLEINKYIN
jgi:hypothetical protein